MAHQRGRKKVTGTSKLPTKIRCIHLEDEYILWKERTGRLVAGSKEDLEEEDNEAWKAQTEEVRESGYTVWTPGHGAS